MSVGSVDFGRTYVRLGSTGTAICLLILQPWIQSQKVSPYNVFIKITKKHRIDNYHLDFRMT